MVETSPLSWGNNFNPRKLPREKISENMRRFWFVHPKCDLLQHCKWTIRHFYCFFHRLHITILYQLLYKKDIPTHLTMKCYNYEIVCTSLMLQKIPTKNKQTWNHHFQLWLTTFSELFYHKFRSKTIYMLIWHELRPNKVFCFSCPPSSKLNPSNQYIFIEIKPF